MPLPTPAQEANESQLRAVEQRQKIYDAYFILFNSDVGRIVLADMHMRAWYKKSTFEGDGKDRGIRDAREGQRNFMLVTDDFITKGRDGVRPPKQSQAVSNTAEASRDS